MSPPPDGWLPPSFGSVPFWISVASLKPSPSLSSPGSAAVRGQVPPRVGAPPFRQAKSPVMPFVAVLDVAAHTRTGVAGPMPTEARSDHENAKSTNQSASVPKAEPGAATDLARRLHE